MKTRILHFLGNISANFWMIPLFSLFIGAGLAFLNFYLDKTLLARHIEYPDLYLYFNNSQNIRSLLSVSATSFLGVAGVSFSITIASLTLASQQFGPRLLRNFMLDRFNQLVLGCFIGTFLYCILLLQFTSSMDLEKTTPFVSMIFLLVLIFINLLVLVFFIHHVAVAIQADTVISDVDKELVAQLLKLFPDKVETDEQPIKLKVPSNIDQKFEKQGKEVFAYNSGYLQALDIDALIKCGSDNKIALKIIVKPGEFIIKDSLIGYFLNRDESDNEDAVKDQINSQLIMGVKPTPEQDPEFAIRQLVEVAVRALSPGINDPFTAISCIDRLADNIALLMGRQFPSDQHVDDSGHLVLQLKPFTINGIIEASFNQIRQHGKNDIAVTIHLLQTLHKLALISNTSEQAKAINKQTRAIVSEQKTKGLSEYDSEDIKHWGDKVESVLKEKI
ncbi:DUF2254 domain-containing protein [uncultured Cocleimonas sp.]|uniref:DUF2254 domain-containing protein n=1 Tax=uncultured Cocleimonas sp. TaxID=1051587 RepID=UPI00261DABCD|nr:DUF2254 domain-containing protein [uncultured Cocleimonas sp.]